MDKKPVPFHWLCRRIRPAFLLKTPSSDKEPAVQGEELSSYITVTAGLPPSIVRQQKRPPTSCSCVANQLFKRRMDQTFFEETPVQIKNQLCMEKNLAVTLLKTPVKKKLIKYRPLLLLSVKKNRQFFLLNEFWPRKSSDENGKNQMLEDNLFNKDPVTYSWSKQISKMDNLRT